MTPKLLPILILILLLFASCASATTLHGTANDVDSGVAVDGIEMRALIVEDMTEILLDTDVTDANGKFDLEVPNDTKFYVKVVGDDSQLETCYFTTFRINTIKNQVSYYPLTDEIFLRFRVSNCDSETSSVVERDPSHPGDNDGDDSGDGDDGDDPGEEGDPGGYTGPTTPGGVTPTSTAGRVGGALACVVIVLAVAAVLVLTGVITLGATVVISGITLTAIGLIKLAAILAAMFGFVVLPLITKWGVPFVSWITGAIQDMGNAILKAFGIHFDETREMSPGDTIIDVIRTVTETIIREIINTITEATGLTEQMVWLIIIFGGMFVLMAAFSMFRQR